jgi:asparagine synthase (glutamine-hydrolysing)
MCGIAGGIGLLADARPDPRRVAAMSAAMRHRGPDGDGLWIAPSGRAVLAHRRLAVIDLATGDQPMLNESGNVGIVFNGEIYNYLELREELTKNGEEFRTRSDTEVLLRLITSRGERSLDLLRGMFAFVAWDDRRRELLVARDRIGKKPLFYGVDGDCLYFSSSLAALRAGNAVEAGIDPQAVDLYLALGYIPAPHTIYRNIYKMPAASFATLADRGLCVRSFWDMAGHAETYSGSYEDALEDLEARLEEAVALRLRSDVPIGVFLSGGIDSSLVAALAARQSGRDIQTFCVGFKESRFDEREYASAVANHLGTNHHSLCAETNLLDMLPPLTDQFGEPYADSSALALSAIAQHARPSITVALGGDGGDEGFGGYSWYGNAARLERYASLVPTGFARIGARAAHFGVSHSWGDRHLGRIERGLSMLPLASAERFAAIRSFMNEGEVEILYDGEILERRRAGINPARSLLSEAYSQASGSALRKMRYADIRTYLADDLMPKVDVATMAHGLEARAPLLDQKVLALALSLPDHFLVDERGGKRILRDLLARHVPRPMFERRKQGFSVPLQIWFSGQLRPQLEALAESEALSELGLLKPDGIRRLIIEHSAGTRDHSQRLFSILQLNSWLTRH